MDNKKEIKLSYALSTFDNNLYAFCSQSPLANRLLLSHVVLQNPNRKVLVCYSHSAKETLKNSGMAGILHNFSDYIDVLYFNRTCGSRIGDIINERIKEDKPEYILISEIQRLFFAKTPPEEIEIQLGKILFELSEISNAYKIPVLFTSAILLPDDGSQVSKMVIPICDNLFNFDDEETLLTSFSNVFIPDSSTGIFPPEGETSGRIFLFKLKNYPYVISETGTYDIEAGTYYRDKRK